jgi:hypothetical protein
VIILIIVRAAGVRLKGDRLAAAAAAAAHIADINIGTSAVLLVATVVGAAFSAAAAVVMAA